MSPSTAPDSTVNQGSAASAPAGMVSGNEGAVNAGTTPVYNIADPLQGSGDPCASTGHLGLAFHQALPLLFCQVPLLVCQEANPVVTLEPGRLETVDRVAPLLPPLVCRQDF